MPVYRYKFDGLNVAKLKNQVPPADASSVSAGSAAALVVWDITAPATSKDDIDDYMTVSGWSFVETDPSTTPQEASDAEIEAATPEDHASSHEPGGGDALAVDAIAGTGSLRTLGTGAQQACAGNDSRLSDDRDPTAHVTDHHSGGSDALVHDSIAGSGTNTHAQVDTHISSVANPHSVTASQAGAPPTSRTLTAGAGLTGGGDLSADRTFNAVANADGSIVVNADDIQVGVLAGDAQHGVRGGGTQHSAATTGTAGFMSSTDKTKLDGIEAGAEVNDADTVTGPASATDNAVTRFDGTTGKVVQNSGVTLDDSDRLSGIKNLRFDSEYNNGNSGAAATVDWNNGQKHRITLTANCTFTLTSLTDGVSNLLIKIIQDATGSRTVTWPASVLWPDGTAPTLSTGANAVDIVSLYWDGTNYFGVANLGFA